MWLKTGTIISFLLKSLTNGNCYTGNDTFVLWIIYITHILGYKHQQGDILNKHQCRDPGPADRYMSQVLLHHNASKFILKEQLVFWQQRDVVSNTHSLCCDQKLPLWLKCVKCSLCCRCWEIRVVWQTHTVFPRRSCYVVKVLCTMLVFDTLAWRYFTTAVSQLWWSTLCFFPSCQHFCCEPMNDRQNGEVFVWTGR